jgi:prophage regulatory protein
MSQPSIAQAVDAYERAPEARPPQDPYLRCQEVLEQTGLSRSTLHRMVKRKEFPAPKQLGIRAVGWRASAVNAWCEGRPDAHPQAA